MSGYVGSCTFVLIVYFFVGCESQQTEVSVRYVQLFLADRNCSSINVTYFGLQINGRRSDRKPSWSPVFRDANSVFNVFVTPPLSVIPPKTLVPNRLSFRLYTHLNCLGTTTLYSQFDGISSYNGSTRGSVVAKISTDVKSYMTLWYDLDYCAGVSVGSYFDCSDGLPRCRKGFHGPKCSSYCVKNERRYSCNVTTGVRTCNPGYDGHDCLPIPPKTYKLEFVVATGVLGGCVLLLAVSLFKSIREKVKMQKKHQAVSSMHVEAEIGLERKISNISTAPSSVMMSPAPPVPTTSSPYGDYEPNYLEVLTDEGQVEADDYVFQPPTRKPSTVTAVGL